MVTRWAQLQSEIDKRMIKKRNILSPGDVSGCAAAQNSLQAVLINGFAVQSLPLSAMSAMSAFLFYIRM
jgi:hypothetical protein